MEKTEKEKQVIENAIRKAEGKLPEDEFYEIKVFTASMNLLKVTKESEGKLYFDDGSDTDHYSRKELYPKAVAETEEFKELQAIFEEIRYKDKQINELYAAKKLLMIEGYKKINFLVSINFT